MYFLSLEFYLFLGLFVCLYYSFPLSRRWYVLLAGSVFLYLRMAAEAFWMVGLSILFSYLMGVWIFKQRSRKKKESRAREILLCSVIVVALPLLLVKHGNPNGSFIVPLGISFYTLQMVSYLVDIYQGKIRRLPEFFPYMLYVLFFPQIVQGPIPRYEQLGEQLLEGHRFSERGFAKAVPLILWGFFLKLMIADKAAVVVNSVFDNYKNYGGCYILVAGILYSIQLYTDFMACVCIAQGAAGLFGISLVDNFKQPYFAVSLKDFWRRWHLSLSSWLRDYIYIPLGGNRKGTFQKYRNLLLVFLVSGLWHGVGLQYLVWGLLHGGYQIVGEWTTPLRNHIYERLRLPKENLLRVMVQRIGTFFWVMLAWILFRAESLEAGIHMILSMFQIYNPWVLFNDSLFSLGLAWKEWVVLCVAIFTLLQVSRWQQRECIRDWVLRQHIVFRWSLYIGTAIVIMVFGSYGFGFNAQDFIYGGF